MTRIEQIRQEAQQIQSYLEITISGGTSEMLERVETLGIYYARSGQLHAEVVGMHDAAIAKVFRDEKDVIVGLPPTLANKLLKGATAELNSLENWLDRINAACSKQADNLRTLISFEKQRMIL